MMSVAKKTELPRVSQRLSVRPEVVNVSPINHVPQEKKHESSFFSERTLTFLGIIASIIALSLALWSIHRGSDLSKRISDLNLSVVDLIVESKKTPVTEQSHTKTSKTIRSKLDDKRARRMERSAKLEDVFQKEMDRSAQIKSEHDKYIASVSKEYLTSQMKLDAENKVLLEQTRQQIDEMKHRREMEAATRSKLNVMDKIEQPNPLEIMGKPLGKMMDMTKQIGDKFAESKEYAQRVQEQRGDMLTKPFPILETRVTDDVDLEDLEKDLKLLMTGQ
jgi:hypothetical protein